MDWVVIAELQFPVKQVEGGGKDDAREYAKGCLEKLREMGVIEHYLILSEPRTVWD